MLFNTLAYARFFVLVFLALWLLVERRNALLLPGLAVAAFVAFAAPSWLGLILVVAIFGLSWAALRRAPRETRPTLLGASALVVCAGGALQFLSWHFLARGASQACRS